VKKSPLDDEIFKRVQSLWQQLIDYIPMLLIDMRVFSIFIRSPRKHSCLLY